MSSLVFELCNITKTFPGIKALNEVNFDCFAGEVHALAGENGAGKSTLIKVLSGVYQADEGTIKLDGKPQKFKHPLQSLAVGISVIYQEFSLLPDRTVAENIFLGRELSHYGILDHAKMRHETDQVLAMFGTHHRFNSKTLVKELDVAEQQMVEIAKAISLDARVIVMDEPTAALNDTESQILFEVVDQMREQGRSIVYITHRMREITRLADRVTVLKDGRTAATFDIVPDPDVIIHAMVGREITTFYPEVARKSDLGEVLLSVKAGGNSRLEDITMNLRAGEITGFAGVQGAGRAALALALFGAVPFTSGQIEILGKPVQLNTPRQAVQAGVVMLPGDRKSEGLALMQSVRDNGMIAARSFSKMFSPPNNTTHSSLENMDAQFQNLDLRAANFDVEIQSLSGGNQQKAIVARWLALAPKVLVFVEPTRGIDVNTKASIYARMRQLAKAGAAVMVVTSDLPEVLGISDRVLVMSAGKIVAEFPHGATEADIMRAATETGAAA